MKKTTSGDAIEERHKAAPCQPFGEPSSRNSLLICWYICKCILPQSLNCSAALGDQRVLKTKFQLGLSNKFLVQSSYRLIVFCCSMLHSLYFAPILFAISRDRTPNLTTVTVTTNYYTPYPIRRPWSRLSHSLMAVSLMSTSCQILHHAYRTASHLGASCISSPLYNPYLASCSSHVLLMTRTHPIGYDPLI